jgi:dephospho-CoA kinase
LFKARTKKDLKILKEMGAPEMKEAIDAYRHVSASPEFREVERLREKARHDEAQALQNAAHKATLKERKKWEKKIADKDAALADQEKLIAELRAKLADDS